MKSEHRKSYFTWILQTWSYPCIHREYSSLCISVIFKLTVHNIRSLLIRWFDWHGWSCCLDLYFLITGKKQIKQAKILLIEHINITHIKIKFTLPESMSINNHLSADVSIYLSSKLYKAYTLKQGNFTLFCVLTCGGY